MRIKKIISFLFVSALAFAAIIPFIGQAAPTLLDTLDEVKNKYTFNGDINAAITDGSTLYVGGSFTSVLRTTGQAVVLDDATGDVSQFLPVITTIGGDTVYAAISDGVGGWYVAGDFTHIDGVAHDPIAHFLSDGTLDADFDTNISTGATIYSLALSSDGGTLYIGKTGAQALVAVDANTGAAVGAFDAQASGGDVYALALSSDGATLYAGGSFVCVGEYTDLDGCLGTTMNNLAGFDAGTGAVTAFSPSINGGGAVNAIVISSDDSVIYAGGSFSAGGDDPSFRQYLAAFGISNSTTTDFLPQPDDVVHSLALSSDDETLYAGGDFTDVNVGTTRNRVAAFDTSDGTATAFDPSLNGSVRAMMLSADNTTLYAGGDFSSVNAATTRRGMAAFSVTTGTATALDASFPNGASSVYTISESYNGAILAGGSFNGVDPIARSEVAAIDLSTYEITDFDPNVLSVDLSVHALALSPDANTLYIGGSFHHVNDGSTARANLAAVDTTTGTATAFDPSTNDTVYSLDVSSDGSTIYAAGAFTMVNTDQSRDYAAAFSSADGTVTAFAPALTDVARAIKLSSDETSVYVGGAFTGGILALDSSDGSTVLSTEFPSNDLVRALALSSDGSTLYFGGSFTAFSTSSVIGEGAIFNVTTSAADLSFPVVATNAAPDATIYASVSDGLGGWYIGGSFTHVGATERAVLAHILSDGTLDPDFLPTIDPTISTIYSLALSEDGSTLYIGGSFSTINATTRNNIAALNTSNGSLTAFDPDTNGTVNTLVLSPNEGTLYAGGSFITVNGGGTSRPYLAAFDTSGAGTATAFDEGFDGEVKAIAISSDGATLYVGGYFNTTIDLTTRNYLAAFTTAATGDLTAFNPDIGDGVLTLSLSSDDNTLYAGGDFNLVNGGVTTRNYLAAFDTDTGTATAFNPNIGGSVYSMSLSSDDLTLYLAGQFNTVGAATRADKAAVLTADGSVTDFNPSSVTVGGSSLLFTVSGPQAGEVFFGGEPMTFTDSVDRNYLAALDTSDFSITDFDPDLNSGVIALALSSDDELLYAGGDFNLVGDDSRARLAAINTVTGNASAFDPGIDATVNALALSPEDDELYVGGTFTTRLDIYSVESVAADDAPAPSAGRQHGQGFASPDKYLQEQINYLLDLIASLKAKLGLIGSVGTQGSQGGLFARNLTIGSTGPDVKALQIYLNTHGFVLATTGPGSPGNETNLFGALTRDALVKFQAAKGISPAAGYFGPLTRAYVNAHP